MEFEIVKAYQAYQDKLTQLAQTIKAQVRQKASLKGVQEALGITAAMYYQRLKYPQNIPPQEIEGLVELVQDNQIRERYGEANQLGQQLAEIIAESLKNAAVTVTFLCKKLGIDTSNYYRKQKDPRLWTQREIEKIEKVVETIKNL